MKRALSALLSFSLFAFGATAFADDDKDHHHHEDLTPAQLGTVVFPVSCAASVQKPFERGVALLHSFWYEEAEKEFLHIANDDPHCAMAHWGVAMSLWHQLWNIPTKKLIQHGLEEVHRRKTPTVRHTAREGISRRHRSFLQRLQKTRPCSPRQGLLRCDEKGVRVVSRRS